MGFSGISPMSLLLVFFIIVALFGADKLKSLGHDLGTAIKQFKAALSGEENNE